MSTTPLEPQIASTEPQPDVFSMPIDDLRAAAFAPPTPEPVAQPQSSEPYTLSQDANGVTITLATEFGGEVYKGKDATEALGKLAKAKADSNAYIKQLRGQQPTTPEPPAFQPQIDPAQEQQAHQQFMAELMREVPPELIEQNIARFYGMNADELRGEVQAIRSDRIRYEREVTLMDFYAECPDFADTPENTALMLKNLEPVAQAGRVPTLDEMKTAWALTLYSGGKPYQPPQPIERPKVPPPTPSATGSQPPSAQSAWSMPLDQLRSQAFGK